MNHGEPTSARERDEAEISAIEADYDRAWNSADIAGLMSVLEPDVVIISPMGRVSVGAGSARRLLEDFLSGPGHGSTHTSHLKKVSFVSDDVALLDGKATIEGPNLPEPLVHDFTDIFVRRRAQWKIAHIRAYVFIDAGAP